MTEFPSQRPVTRSFDVFFDLRPNKRLSKLSRRRWFETPSRSLWRYCNDSAIHHCHWGNNSYNSLIVNKANLKQCFDGLMYHTSHIYIYNGRWFLHTIIRMTMKQTKQNRVHISFSKHITVCLINGFVHPADRKMRYHRALLPSKGAITKDLWRTPLNMILMAPAWHVRCVIPVWHGYDPSHIIMLVTDDGPTRNIPNICVKYS